MAQNITLLGANYPDVPAVELPKTGGGTALFTDVSDTTAAAADVAAGKYFYDSSGVKTPGSAQTRLILGAIRPDAELVQTWSYDKLIHEDEGITIPAYTTTDTTLKSWQALTPTYTADRNNYYWFAQCRGLAIPIYNSSAIDAGRCEYTASCMEQEYVIIPANSAKAIVDNTKSNAAWSVALARQASYNRNIYWSNASTLAIDTQSYGPYLNFGVDIAMGGSTITARAPFLKIRGHATYFNSTYWAALTDIRYQYVIELYRVPKNSLNLGGWNTYQQLTHAIDCAGSANHKLT